MLDKQPSLLLHTFTVTDPAGYTITATPLSHEWAMCSYYACALGFDYGIYGTRPPSGIMFCPHSVAIGIWDNYYRQKQALFRNLCCDIQVQKFFK